MRLVDLTSSVRSSGKVMIHTFPDRQTLLYIRIWVSIYALAKVREGPLGRASASPGEIVSLRRANR
jgi:hypothetical protein